MAVSSRRHSTTRFNLSRSLSLDKILAAEELALEAWSRIESTRRRDFGDVMHPLLHDIALTAWKAYCGLGAQRRSMEREWRVPA